MGLAGVGVSNAIAKEKVPPSPEVAAKITDVVRAAYPDAVIGAMAKENEDGLNFVEVALTSKGTKIDLDVMEDGTIVESEVSADISSFPEKAAEALNEATKGMKVLATDIATTYAEADANDPSGNKAVKLDQPKVAYERDVKKGGKKGEFAVDAEGKILESPKWYKKAEKDEDDEKGEGKEGKMD
jgi:hypothetical protein